MVVSKLIHEDKNLKFYENIEKEEVCTFSKEILCGWDNSLTTVSEVNNHKGLMCEMLTEKLSEANVQGQKKSRTNMQLLTLYCQRFLGLIAYLIIQCVTYTTIILLTIKSKQLQSKLASYKFIKTFASFVVPICVTAINALSPSLFKKITELESWDSGQTELNVLLLRMYISNMMNVFILALSFALLADPFLLADNAYYTIRKNVEYAYVPDSYTCRLNQAADGLFALIISEFFVNGAQFIGSGLYPQVLNKYVMPWGKPEFEIAERMVALLYFVSLMIMSFPYAPLTLILMPFLLALRLKLEKIFTMKFYTKPTTSWTAYKAGRTFAIFFVLSLLLIGLPSLAYMISTKTFAKDCSIQDDALYICKDIAVNNTCESINTNSKYSKLYTDDTKYCDVYPSCICSDACGPFVHETSAFQTFREIFKDNFVLHYFWYFSVQTSYGSWILALLFYIIASMKNNTIKANQSLYDTREQSLETMISTLEIEKKKYEKIMQRLKLIEEPSVANGNGSDIITANYNNDGSTIKSMEVEK